MRRLRVIFQATLEHKLHLAFFDKTLVRMRLADVGQVNLFPGKILVAQIALEGDSLTRGALLVVLPGNVVLKAVAVGEPQRAKVALLGVVLLFVGL